MFLLKLCQEGAHTITVTSMHEDERELGFPDSRYTHIRFGLDLTMMYETG